MIGVGKQLVEPARFGWVLMVGTVCFVLPYVLLASLAGFLADRFNKRNVILACNVGEVVLMVLAVGALYLDPLGYLMGVLALMGSQIALFGPSKLGSIPEMLRADRISTANGMIGLTTVVATIVGTAIGNLLSDITHQRGPGSLWISASVLIGVAVIGCLTSLAVWRLPIANPRRRFPWNAFRDTWEDVRRLAVHRPLLRVALGIMFFWSLGALANMNIDQFAAEGGT